ncbi:MAG TPA: tetratricopeptide repeat protein [Planctomycetota bacterium]|nr:tetratricopeptide repeat protein [Planctomycetota bacterium]
MKLLMPTAFAAAALLSCASSARGPSEPSTESVEMWREMANRHPGLFAPRLYLAYDALSRQDWPEFDRLLRDLEGLADADGALAGPCGTLCLVAGQKAPASRSTHYLETARRALEKANKQTEPNAEIAFNLGAACFLLRDFQAASGSLQQALEREPGNPNAVTLLVRSLLEQGEPASALGWIERAHGSMARSDRNELVALCRYMMGQHDQAIQAYQAAIDADSTSPRLWHNLGLCYEESRQIEKARACFAKAEALRQTVPDRR